MKKVILFFLCVLCALCGEVALAAVAPAGASLRVTTRGADPQACPAAVCLAWDASPTSGVTYNVYRSTTANGCANETAAGCVKVNSAPVTVLVYNDSSVDAGNFFYTVRAEKNGALSLASNEVPVPLRPGAPGNLRRT